MLADVIRMYASLSTLTVIRNASPLILLGAERLMFGVPITKDAIISLSTILIGKIVISAPLCAS